VPKFPNQLGADSLSMVAEVPLEPNLNSSERDRGLPFTAPPLPERRNVLIERPFRKMFQL